MTQIFVLKEITKSPNKNNYIDWIERIKNTSLIVRWNTNVYNIWPLSFFGLKNFHNIEIGPITK